MSITELLDHLDELHTAASPGPWTAATAPAEGSDESHADYVVGALRPEEGRPLWVTWAPKVDEVHGDTTDYVVPAVTGDGPTSRANASFIAGAHAALPRLTAALRAVLDLADELESYGETLEGAGRGRSDERLAVSAAAMKIRRVVDEAVQA